LTAILSEKGAAGWENQDAGYRMQERKAVDVHVHVNGGDDHAAN